MNISLESLIVIALLVAVAIVSIRVLVWLVGLLVVAFAIVFGLALASDLVTGGHALQELANKLAPAIAGVMVSFVAWLKSKRAE